MPYTLYSASHRKRPASVSGSPFRACHPRKPGGRDASPPPEEAQGPLDGAGSRTVAWTASRRPETRIADGLPLVALWASARGSAADMSHAWAGAWAGPGLGLGWAWGLGLGWAWAGPGAWAWAGLDHIWVQVVPTP